MHAQEEREEEGTRQRHRGDRGQLEAEQQRGQGAPRVAMHRARHAKQGRGTGRSGCAAHCCVPCAWEGGRTERGQGAQGTQKASDKRREREMERGSMPCSVSCNMGPATLI